MALFMGRDDRKRDEREGSCSKGSQVGPEAWAAAARIKPVYMGHALC